MQRRISEEQLTKVLANTRGSMAMEGFTVTEDDEALIKAVLRGELSDAEFLRIARERALSVE